jgi:hypothetical protein
MGPQPGTTSLRKVRTFADDLRRAQAGTSVDVGALTTATSVVAPTVDARRDVHIDILHTAPSTPAKKQGFLGGLSNDLMDIRNVERGTEEATIVSERKAKNWSFSDAIVGALVSWWHDTIADIKSDIATPVAKSMPSHALPEKSSRIVRAPEVAPQVPMPTTLPAAAAPEPQSDTEPRWTHMDAKAEPAPKIARAVIRPVVNNAPTLPPVPTLPPEPTPVFRSSSSAPQTPLRPLMRREEINDTMATPTTDVTLAAREAAIKEESSKFAARAREAATRRKDYEATQSNTQSNSSTYFVYGTLGVIAVSLLVLVASAGYALWGRGTSLVEAPKPGLAMLFAVSESVAVPLQNDRAELMIDLAKRVADTRGEFGSFVRLYFYYQNDTKETELPTQAFIDALDLRAPGSMIRTILGTSMFGVYLESKNAPFLVLKVRNFEDALGGMLLFEKNMNSDLAPVFGENLDRIGEQGVFRDEVIGGVDARSLYDIYGNMLLTYAFIDRETIVITTSYTALGALAQVLK